MRQHGAERELVRRCDVHQAGIVGDGVDDQPVLVDRHANDRVAADAQLVDCRWVARFFDGHDLARFEHGSSGEVESVQGARGDDNVGRSGHDPAGAADPVRQHGSQFGVTDRVAVVGGVACSAAVVHRRHARKGKSARSGLPARRSNRGGPLRTGSANVRISATTARGRIAEPTRSADEGDSMSLVTNVPWLRRPSTVPSATSRP